MSRDGVRAAFDGAVSDAEVLSLLRRVIDLVPRPLRCRGPVETRRPNETSRP